MALIAVHWTHLVASVIWIGGIAFILFVAMPSCKQVLGAEAGRAMSEMSRRFVPLANWSIVLLVITGIALAATKGEDGWTARLAVKYILALMMIAVHFYRGLFLAPRIMRSVSDSEKSSLQKLSLGLVKVNFGLGLTVLLLSGHHQFG